MKSSASELGLSMSWQRFRILPIDLLGFLTSSFLGGGVGEANTTKITIDV